MPTNIDITELDAMSLQEEIKYIRNKVEQIADLQLDTKLLEQHYKGTVEKVVDVQDALKELDKEIDILQLKVKVLEDRQADNRKMILGIGLVIFGTITGIWLI